MKDTKFRDRILSGYGVKTVAELSQRLPEVPYNTLRDWLNQKSEPPLDYLQRFARESGKSIDWLLTGNDATQEDFKVIVARKIDGSHVVIDEPLKQKILRMLDVLLEATDR